MTLLELVRSYGLEVSRVIDLGHVELEATQRRDKVTIRAARRKIGAIERAYERHLRGEHGDCSLDVCARTPSR